jgi:hypothetical protein
MKKQRLALLATTLAFTSFSQAAIVSQTFSGTTKFKVIFTPPKTGMRTALIRISNSTGKKKIFRIQVKETSR